jgi:hypothetical protein
LAVHLLLPQITELQRSIDVVRQMVWWAVGLAVLAQVLSYLGGALLLQSLVNLRAKRIRFFESLPVMVAANSVGLVAGGILGMGTAIYRWLRADGIDAESAFLSTWLMINVNNGTMLLAAVFGLAHLLTTHQLTAIQAVGFGLVLAALAAVVAIMLWGVRHQAQVVGWAVAVARRWARIWHRSFDPATTEAGAGQLLGIWRHLPAGASRLPLLGAAMDIVFDMLTLFFVFSAAGTTLQPAVLLAGYGLPLLLGKVSFLPGGLGIVEGTMVAIYASLGIPTATTVVVTLVYRLLSFWAPTLLGLVLATWLNRSSRRRTA